jgi:hypothetical protein
MSCAHRIQVENRPNDFDHSKCGIDFNNDGGIFYCSTTRSFSDRRSVCNPLFSGWKAIETNPPMRSPKALAKIKNRRFDRLVVPCLKWYIKAQKNLIERWAKTASTSLNHNLHLSEENARCKDALAAIAGGVCEDLTEAETIAREALTK